MKPDKLCIGIVTVFILLSFLVAPAWAGSPQHHRWEGVAIGIGAVMVGSALLHGLHRTGHQQHPVYNHQLSPNQPQHRGKWQMRRIWVQPTSKKIWNPGHYDRRGKWIRGKWIKVEDRPGYWKEERVWMSRR